MQTITLIVPDRLPTVIRVALMVRCNRLLSMAENECCDDPDSRQYCLDLAAEIQDAMNQIQKQVT